MSLLKLLDKSKEEFLRMNPDELTDEFSGKVKDRNHTLAPPAKIKIAVPLAAGVIIGSIISIIVKRTEA